MLFDNKKRLEVQANSIKEESMNDFVDNIIDVQKRSEVDPFLKSRVMSQVDAITSGYERRMRLYLRLAYYCCFAVSIICSVYLGQTLGDSYPVHNNDQVHERGVSLFFEEGVESQFILYNN